MFNRFSGLEVVYTGKEGYGWSVSEEDGEEVLKMMGENWWDLGERIDVTPW